MEMETAYAKIGGQYYTLMEYSVIITNLQWYTGTDNCVGMNRVLSFPGHLEQPLETKDAGPL